MQNADGQVLIRAEIDTAAVSRGISEMKTALIDLKNHAARQFALIRSQAETEGGTMSQWIPTLASRLIGSLVSGLTDGGKRVGSALRSVLDSAYMTGTGGTSQFSGIGSHVISGIISGIQGTASALWNTLRSIASNMLATLKNALGIQSPSRLMREEVGHQIGAGIAGGMLDCREQIASAAQTLANDAAAGMQGRITVPVSAAGTILRGAVAPMSHLYAGSPARADRTTTGRAENTALGGNTFIFQKPVETPYQHAQAIRDTMEAMLYGT